MQEWYASRQFPWGIDSQPAVSSRRDLRASGDITKVVTRRPRARTSFCAKDCSSPVLLLKQDDLENAISSQVLPRMPAISHIPTRSEKLSAE